MRVLIDTHVFLWWIEDRSLSPHVFARLANPDTGVYVSAISLFELAMKISLGKLNVKEPLHQHVGKNNFRVLPFNDNHALAVETLPWHHRDPFDRMLIAQAMAEGMPIMTADDKFFLYNVSAIRA